MFRIKSIKNDSLENIKVYNERDDVSGNYYTIVTGDNSCGKSSLLSKAVNYFLFSNKGSVFSGGVGLFEDPVVTSIKYLTPSSIIAICNSRFDKFTPSFIYEKQMQSELLNDNFINYVHPEKSNSIKRSISDAVLLSVKRRMEVSDEVYRKFDVDHNLCKAFEMFNVEPVLHVKFSISKKNAYDLTSYIESNRYLHFTFNSEKNTEDFYRNKAHLQDTLRNFHQLLKAYNGNSSNLSLLYNSLTLINDNKLRKKDLEGGFINIAKKNSPIYLQIRSDKHHIPENIVQDLIFLEILNIDEVNVRRIDDAKEVNVSSLSSGQQTLLEHALIISSSAEPGCLICIDEPENSLHPEWQLNYMKFLSLLCHEDLNAHIMVATHSPQIVSGMQNDNGCVLSLKKRDFRKRSLAEYESLPPESEFYDLQSVSLYRNQSAGKQLMGIFKSPGYKNDFLLSKLILILSKQSKKISPTKDDEKLIDEVKQLVLRERVPEGDPAILLFKQVISFESARKLDDK